MTVSVKVPDLGEGVDSVEVVSVLVEVGSKIAKEQPLVEVETDKAAVEIPSTTAGTISEIHVKVGDSLTSGDVIVTLDEADQEQIDDQPADGNVEVQPASDSPSEDGGTSPPTEDDETHENGIVTVSVPDLGDEVDGVDVVSVLVAIGDRIEDEQGLVEVETDKAAVEIPSTASGRVSAIHVTPGDRLEAGQPIVTLEDAVAGQPRKPPVEIDSDEPAPQATEPSPPSAAAEDGAHAEPSRDAADAPLAPRWQGADRKPRTLVPAAPTVRRFAREVGVDISKVTGSGPGGRLSIDDVKLHAKRMLSQVAEGGVGIATGLELPDFSRFGAVRREAMSKVRRLTAENLARAWVTVPQVTNHDLADATDLEKLRQRFKDRVAAAGGKLTVTAILVKVVASAMKAFPTVNASVDMATHEVVFKDYVHIGVAVDTERGLLVPVIRDANLKNITQIAVELDDLARRARDRKLKPDEMQGASFTISNLGGIGGTGFSPIVNWPEVAILGVSRGRTQPEWIDGQWQPRVMLPLSLSYDHRLVDGADAARFLRWVAEALEQPLLLSLEG
jgi:pyruvate dehydrogenase E2 component (dihydrolipoamide acetyltransferase)